MIIIDGIAHIPSIENAVVTSGTFDGVHLGHQKILNQVLEAAAKIKGKSVVLTFWPHPRMVLSKDNSDLKLLSTFEERAALLEKAGIDYLIKINFTLDFSQMSSQDFIQDILIDKIQTKQLIIGYDHKFGRNREGSFEYIKSRADHFGFSVLEISKQDLRNQSISSTEVRKALEEGRCMDAAQLLGRQYSISGTVVKGQQIGTKIGFPTANIHIKESYKMIPKAGAYAVKVAVKDQQYDGMLNIGWRPTVDGDSQVIEVNIFNFAEDLYAQDISIHFFDRLRDEVKFDSLEALTHQLEADQAAVIKILSNNSISFRR